MERDAAADLATEIARLQAIVLFATAYRVLHNQEAAEDVLQEVFLQIWEKAPLYDPLRGKPLTWAITLTRNRAIDRLRAVQRRNRLQDDVQREAETDEQFDDRSSFDVVASGETGKLVRAALVNLSADQRQAIELAFFSSLTQVEIAERLGEPLGTVKARIRRGMMKLRELIDPNV
jgi:RNA polymerase sigma-70 factor (ECF subfamily)